MAPLAAYAGSWGTGSPSPNIDQKGCALGRSCASSTHSQRPPSRVVPAERYDAEGRGPPAIESVAGGSVCPVSLR